MKQLFSPWRMRYLNESADGCIFCALPEEKDDRQSLIVAREPFAYVLLNRFPYTSGHLMVAPYDHQASLELLDNAVQTEIMSLVARAVGVLRKVYQPEGFNLGANIGSAAGAGFAEHVHFHIVPRWAGDTNFMSTLGEIRVLPEELETTWQRVREAWKNG